MLGNIYLISLAIVALMLLDYYLTLKGFALYAKKYAKHIVIESYELNPAFSKNIKRGKYSAKHGLSVILVISILIFLYEGAKSNAIPIISVSMYHMAEGMLLSAFAYVNVRHLKNIFLFFLVRKNTKLLQGKVEQSRSFSLMASVVDSFGMFLVLSIVFIAMPNFFSLGFASGPLIIMLSHFRWLRKISSKNDN